MRSLHLCNVYTHLRNPIPRLIGLALGELKNYSPLYCADLSKNYSIPLWTPHLALKDWNPWGSALIPRLESAASMANASSSKLALPVPSVLSTGFVVMPCIPLNMLSCTWLGVLVFYNQESFQRSPPQPCLEFRERRLSRQLQEGDSRSSEPQEVTRGRGAPKENNHWNSHKSLEHALGKALLPVPQQRGLLCVLFGSTENVECVIHGDDLGRRSCSCLPAWLL